MILLNGSKVTPTIFPDGTSQVWRVGSISFPSVIRWEFESEAEFIHLIQLFHLVKNVSDAEVSLELPYLPYARQDKQIDDLLTFALHPFLHVLSTMDWSSMRVFDPHSDIITQYIPDAECVMPEVDVLARCFDWVCFPDKGAASRYETTAPYIVCEKIRDQSNGRITSFYVNGDAHGSVIVVDDLCDGGATFLMVGKALREMGCKPSLYVSHGVFSRGQEGVNDLLGVFSEVFTTDSRKGVHNLKGLTVLPCPV